MSLKYSIAVRNAQLAAVEATIGASPTLEIRTGAPPANCAAADSGTLLATLALPADWMGAPLSGSVAKSGTWSGTATAAGTAGHYRIKGGGQCHEQGTITATGSGGDMTLDNVSIAVDQPITIATYTKTAGNA